MQNWLSFYGLKKDPFVTTPIDSGEKMILFFKTKDISSSIDPFILQLNKSLSSIRVLVGERGMGKTTAIRYIERKARDVGFITASARFAEKLL